MAFSTTGLDIGASGSKGGIKLHTYVTTDAIATVETANYFNSVHTLFTNGDRLFAEMSDGAKVYRLTKSAGVVTLNAAYAVAALTGTLTGTANGSLVDIAAAAGACAGGSTPTAAQVDTAIATAVATIVSGTNEQLKEIQTVLNKVVKALGGAG